jgi:hypothetical protein
LVLRFVRTDGPVRTGVDIIEGVVERIIEGVVEGIVERTTDGITRGRG